MTAQAVPPNGLVPGRWISVCDALPALWIELSTKPGIGSSTVLVFTEDEDFFLAWLNSEFDRLPVWQVAVGDELLSPCRLWQVVTHWMPLPFGPNDKETEKP